MTPLLAFCVLGGGVGEKEGAEASGSCWGPGWGGGMWGEAGKVSALLGPLFQVWEEELEQKGKKQWQCWEKPGVESGLDLNLTQW